MSFKRLIFLIRSDYKRYETRFNVFLFLIHAFIGIGPFQAVFIYRISRYLKLKNIPIIHSLLNKFNIVVNGSEISPYADIDQGFKVAHTLGVVIGKNVKIGSNFTIFHNATIGAKTPYDGLELMPTIGDNVTVYTGAKVLGDIVIEENCKIGANVVITESLPSNTLVGVNKESLFKKRMTISKNG